MSVDACPVARTRSDVTPEWLSGLFGCPITSVGLQPVGTGQMGSLLRAELSFADGQPNHIPTSLIVKLAAESDDVRAACTSMGLYEAEVRFFQELAPLFGRSVPHCYHAALDSQAGWFTLVLEDLADRAVPASQAPGTRVDKAAAALRELSGLQALTGDDHDVAQLPWLNRSRGERFFRAAAASCEPFLNRFGAQLGDRHVALFERVLPIAVDWAGSWQGPMTISHGDYRLDNLMMAADAAATRVIIVDWQTAKVGPPLLDVTYYLGGCLSERERFAHERDLLADYCRSLEAAGVGGYSFAQCWEDYRRCSVYGLFMTALGVQATPTPRGDAMIVASARHCADFVLSLEAEELIPTSHLIDGGRHRLAKGEPLARESLAFMLQLPEAGVAAAIYTWVNGAGLGGSSLLVYGPGVSGERIAEGVNNAEVPDDADFGRWHVGPLTMRILEPMQSVTVEFAGKDLEIEYRFEGSHPAYIYSSHPDGSPAFFADDRYEQSGRVTGRLRIGDQVLPIDTTAHRDHSWGTRDWGAVQHYKWIVSQAGPDTAVHVFDIQALGRRYLRGYVYKHGEMAQVRDADCAFAHDDRWWQTAVNATILDSLGRTTHFDSETFASARAKHGPLTAIETGMTVEIDGKPGIGHVEMAWQTPYLEHLAATQEVIRS